MIIRIIILRTIIGLSTTSWVIVWIILEINIICICFLINKDNKENKEKNTPRFIYFIVQAFASVVFLRVSQSPLRRESIAIVILMCLIVKIGVWPAHNWYIKVISHLKIENISLVLLMTWQKILPIVLSTHLTKIYRRILIIFILSRLIIPTLQIKKQISIKSLLALSSVNNNGWLLSCIFLSNPLLLLFLFLYSIRLTIVLIKIKEEKETKQSNPARNWIFYLILLINLGGLPPILIFIGKVLVINIMVSQNMLSLRVIIVLIACIFLYHYVWRFNLQVIKAPLKAQAPIKPLKIKKGVTGVVVTRSLMLMLLII